MTQQRGFTKKFAEEAVRLVQTSGRTQREIAGDLGIGLSTLVRWIGRSRDRHAVDPAVSRRRKASRRRASLFRDRLAAGAVGS
jgi:transposase